MKERFQNGIVDLLMIKNEDKRRFYYRKERIPI